MSPNCKGSEQFHFIPLSLQHQSSPAGKLKSQWQTTTHPLQLGFLSPEDCAMCWWGWGELESYFAGGMWYRTDMLDSSLAVSLKVKQTLTSDRPIPSLGAHPKEEKAHVLQGLCSMDAHSNGFGKALNLETQHRRLSK